MTKCRFLLSILAASFLVSCGGSPSGSSFPAAPPTGAESSLSDEINKVRTAANKEPLKRSSKLDALAASEAARLAASKGKKPNVTNLRTRAGYGRLAVLVGSLKDRGPSTGARYPTYWMKGAQGKEYILGDWYRFGVGTAKTEDGNLQSTVLFGSIGGASLMSPMGL